MKSIGDVARAFLRNNLKDIDFDYGLLTDSEKALCTREEFDRMERWVKDPLSFAQPTITERDIQDIAECAKSNAGGPVDVIDIVDAIRLALVKAEP